MFTLDKHYRVFLGGECNHAIDSLLFLCEHMCFTVMTGVVVSVTLIQHLAHPWIVHHYIVGPAPVLSGCVEV